MSHSCSQEEFPDRHRGWKVRSYHLSRAFTVKRRRHPGTARFVRQLRGPLPRVQQPPPLTRERLARRVGRPRPGVTPPPGVPPLQRRRSPCSGRVRDRAGQLDDAGCRVPTQHTLVVLVPVWAFLQLHRDGLPHGPHRPLLHRLAGYLQQRLVSSPASPASGNEWRESGGTAARQGHRDRDMELCRAAAGLCAESRRW